MHGKRVGVLHSTLYLGASIGALLVGASAQATAQQDAASINIQPQPVASALRELATETGANVLFTPDSVSRFQAPRVAGRMTPNEAARRLVAGMPLRVVNEGDGAIIIQAAQVVPEPQAPRKSPQPESPASIETVVVTAQKQSEDIQSVPIAVSAFTQKELKERQVATGGDLIREVPNMNFGKTNFSGYSIELRGIGTQAISVTTDPAVAVAFNGTPFLRNHFFEQEFYDLADVEVLRGPQGTLYGRNATAGVVNLTSAKPSDEFEAMGSIDLGNYDNRRFEGMINLPIVGDKLDLRIAGEWTKRDGYSVNELMNDEPIDGRDLWSGRASLRWRPASDLDINLVWEHFSEDDDRLRSGKQLCKTDPTPAEVGGFPVRDLGGTQAVGDFIGQGCLPTSLYSKDAFEVPNGFTLPYYTALLGAAGGILRDFFNPYAGTTQSTNLRAINSVVNPKYRAKNDIVELNADYTLSPTLTLTSQSGFNHDFLWSTEDYNRFDTAPGIFAFTPGNGIVTLDPQAGMNGVPANAGVFCDPQLGCSDRLALQDLSDERAWQASQEFRLTSNFSGPFNFSVGANYLHYETIEDYYVFINTLTLFATGEEAQNVFPYQPGVTDGHQCLEIIGGYRQVSLQDPQDPRNCSYIDPNPITSVNGNGHNYFRSQNPYVLNSYAAFGEAYYNITDELKFTGGLRFTDDQKHFTDIPSELLQSNSYGFLTTGHVNQEWDQVTGRAVADWSPKLDFTDQTLLYASFSHGYKAGGANPPGAIFPTVDVFNTTGVILNPIHPLTFKPEFIDAYELGTKNSLFDDTMTLNGDVFYYNYMHYQISEIVDRTAINQNYDAHVLGAELESTWEPLPGLRFNFAGGLEQSQLANGQKNVDLIDRTAGQPGWMVVKPFISVSSNCILPTYVVAVFVANNGGLVNACAQAYGAGNDPVTQLPYVPNPTVGLTFPPPAGYPGFNPASAPNNGQGFSKDLSHHQLPNAPPFTLSFGSQYTVPVTANWAATLRGDFYWQGNSWARVFNDKPYDQLHGYTNLNLALILNSADGWQAMAYVKNVFNTTAITGDFLNSDDTGLTTNVFLTDPRLFGVRITKTLGAGEWAPADDFASWFTDTDDGRPLLWVELGGQFEQVVAARDAYTPAFIGAVTIPAQQRALDIQQPPAWSLGEEASVTFQPPDSDWQFVGSVLYGRNGAVHQKHQQTANARIPENIDFTFGSQHFHIGPKYYYPSLHVKFADGAARSAESHTIIDFAAGKDIGIGKLTQDSTAVLTGGLRFAQFTATSHVTMRAIPDLHYPSAPITSLAQRGAFLSASVAFHAYSGFSDSKRSFRGVGPEGSFKESTPLFGSADSSEIDLDWGSSLGVLFGRQKTHMHNSTQSRHYQFTNWVGRVESGNVAFGEFGFQSKSGLNDAGDITHRTSDTTIDRDRTTVVPNLGASLGLSYKYKNARVSFGYRADWFIGAMDAGQTTPHSEDRLFVGPFVHLSIGLGG